jgi:cellulose synthase/poly-beta-1,6-N-acetylglucosamine synthase-like glycosyltransferase
LSLVARLIRLTGRLAAAAVLGVVGPLTAYLVALTLGAAREARRLRQPPAATAPLRFIILVPAHDEAATIQGLVATVQAQDYPAAAAELHIVADNCTDETATLARAAGVSVHERFDAARRGKGYALAWLIEKLQAAGARPDVWLVIDADSILAPDLLSRLAAYIAAGAEVVQARYDVLDDGTRWTSSLRAAAFGLVHHVRPLGKRWYGGSAGLKGNGMAFTDAALRAVPWEAASLAEDVEHHLRLLEHGYRVVYAPEARLWTEMPATLQGSDSQNQRWEAGRVALVRQRIPAVIRDGLRRRDPALLDAAAEQLAPPFAVLMAATLAGLAAALIGRAPGLARLLGLCWLGQALYTVGGLYLAGASRSAWLALLRAPFYIAWKAWLYLRVLLGDQPRAWVRTERAPR